MIKTLKKAVKWYFEKAAETYAWTPTCTIPYIRKDDEESNKEDVK